MKTVLADIAADGGFLLPIHLQTARHSVLDKAGEVALSDESTHERIVSITDRWLVKIKTSDRRGAMWQDANGTWWLLAAGRRKDDGSGDFYRELDRLGGVSDSIVPTLDDLGYQRYEAAYVATCRAERDAQFVVLSALLRAAHGRGDAQEVEVFGANVSITVRPNDDVDVLEMSWQFRTFAEQDRFPADVLAMVPALESVDDWDYLPPRSGADRPFTWYTYVTHEWVDWLATAAELDDLIGENWQPPTPRTDGSERFSHYSTGQVVTIAYVTGVEIVGLCGAVVIPHRDPEQFPVCPACSEAVELIRRFGRDAPEPPNA
jgi:hypothetical protein